MIVLYEGKNLLSELNGLSLPSTREGVSEANQTRFKA